jgi:hypothetical protein
MNKSDHSYVGGHEGAQTMDDRIRGAIILSVLSVTYVMAVQYRHPTHHDDTATKGLLEQIVGKNMSAILDADATVIVPPGGAEAEVMMRGTRRTVTLANRPAIAQWLCNDSAPSNTVVVLAVDRRQTTDGVVVFEADKNGLLRRLLATPFPLPCTSSARFYSLDIAPVCAAMPLNKELTKRGDLVGWCPT